MSAGLRLARAAGRLEPDVSLFLSTLGIAQYRVGLVPEALATLTRSNALNMGKSLRIWPSSRWPTSAWARPPRPAPMLDRLRDLLRQENFTDSPGDQGHAFLAEAEVVALYDPIFPADPFAP